MTVVAADDQSMDPIMAIPKRILGRWKELSRQGAFFFETEPTLLWKKPNLTCFPLLPQQ